MKNSIWFSLLLVCFISCDGCRKTYARYELVNLSGQEIVIKSFSRNNPEDGVRKEILIQMNEEWISIEFQTSEPGAPNINPESPEIFDGDSLVIIFNQTRFISNSTFLIEQFPNLFSGATYQRREYDDYKTALRYVFTEEDYENASLIEN